MLWGAFKTHRACVLYAGFAFALASCGSEIKKPSYAEKPTYAIPVSLIQNTSQNLKLDAEGNLKASQDLKLTGAEKVTVSAYLVKIVSCSSGLSTSNEEKDIIQVYPHDTGCVAELLSFVVGEYNYKPQGSGAIPFKSYTVGSTAIFQGDDANDLIEVKVLSQLSNPVQSTDKISFRFAIVSSERNANGTDDQNGQSVTLTGTPAPNFKINEGDASLVSIVESGDSAGAGMFTVKLTCSTGPMTIGEDPHYNSFCPDFVSGGTIKEGDSGVDIGLAHRFSYKLIKAPNDNGTLSFEEAETAFREGGDANVSLSQDLVSDSSGFQTITMTGPVTITSSPRMLLILQSKNPSKKLSHDPKYSSYQYFPINLDIPLNLAPGP